MIKRFLAGLIPSVFALLPAKASIIVVAPTPTATGAIQFTKDIMFTITTAGFAETFVF